MFSKKEFAIVSNLRFIIERTFDFYLGLGLEVEGLLCVRGRGGGGGKGGGCGKIL